MKILTWNINGFRSTNKKGLFSPVLDMDLDIICLQEIKMNEPVREYNYNAYHNYANKKGYSGVAVLTKIEPLNIFDKIGEEKFDSEGRFLMLEYEDFYLINLYVPQGGRQKENLQYKINSLSKIYQLINSLKKDVIICTDFNIAHKNIDVLNYKTNYNNIMFTKEEREVLQNYLNMGLIDTFRFLNPTKQSFSWWSNAFNCRERNIGWRIDYIFINDGLKDSIKSANYLKDIKGSDHCPLLVELNKE